MTAAALTDEVALGRQHAIRQERHQRGRERLRRLVAFHHRDESLVKRRLLRRVETDVVLDRVRQTAEQIRVGHHLREPLRQHRDRQRERSRDARKNMCLVGEIVGGTSRSARFGVHGCLRRARRFGVRMSVYDSTGLERRLCGTARSLPRTRRRGARQDPPQHRPRSPTTPLRHGVLGTRRREARAAPARLCERRALRRRRRAARCHCGFDRARPRVLARARRPAGDGRRRPAPRASHDAHSIRRGHRDPRRRRATGARVRDPLRGSGGSPPGPSGKSK